MGEMHAVGPGGLESPWDYYRQLRAEAPVYRDPHTGIFHVATYDLVMEVVKNHEVYSNRFAPAMGGSLAAGSKDPELEKLAERAYPGVDTMLTADPPEHKRFRGLVNKAFTPRRVKLLEMGGVERDPPRRIGAHVLATPGGWARDGLAPNLLVVAPEIVEGPLAEALVAPLPHPSPITPAAPPVLRMEPLV